MEAPTVIHSPRKTSNMGLNDEKVKEIIGKEVWDILHQSVTSGELEPLKMREVARKLHPTVGGAHLRRTGPTGKRESDWHEMREILNDWYQQELYEYAGEWAMGRLVDIFKSDAVKLPNIAGQLEGLMSSSNAR